MTANHRFFALFVSTLLALAAHPAFAQEPSNSAMPAITVTGAIGGAPGSVTFDRDALEKMGLVTIKTSTPWRDGVAKFEGVPMQTLIKTAGFSGTQVRVEALNDYSSGIPMSDFEEYTVILAVKRDGQYMPVSDRGPFHVIYPFDSDPVLQDQPYYGRSVWQVKSITVE